MVNVVNDESFELEVLNATCPYFVDFYADWCGPCKMMAPIIDQLSEEFEGKIKFAKCNIDNNQSVGNKYHIMSIPTMIIFVDGQVMETIVGGTSKKDLADKINEHLPK